jgi:predicted short-subunit dehydrogenase-like oxidoreductase (DUF2520 family)
VLNRSLASAARAVQFVGGGQAVDRFDQLGRADLFMISANDDAIGACCRQLGQTGVLGKGVVVFHCSGALTSTVLEPAQACGAQGASVHPIKSFADPAMAVQTFVGTYAAIEGDPDACQLLGDALARCGAVPIDVDPQQKATYHAATVFASNYLVAVIEVALRCLQRAGIPRETGLKVLEPMVSGAVGECFRLGPVRALTGPIARGEVMVVAKHCEALAPGEETIHRLYRDLGRIASDLSAAQGSASSQALTAIRELITSGSSPNP